MSSGNENGEKGDAGVPSDSDDDFICEEVSLEDDWSGTEGEEDLETTLKTIQTREEALAPGPNTRPPEAVDDFLRNFLLQMGMTETLDNFQTEWNEMVQKGLVDTEQVGVVPDVYIDNHRLEMELRNAQRERDEYMRAAPVAAQTLARVQRARDLHRLQHKRVVQERNRLIEEMRKLKVQCESYEPVVKRMNEKYQAVLKQTVLVTLQRDKVLGQMTRSTSAGEAINKKGETSIKGQPVSQSRSATGAAKPGKANKY